MTINNQFEFSARKILRIIMIMPVIFKLFKKVGRLIEEEYYLTAQSTARIILLSLTFLSLLTSTMVCINALLFVLFISLSLSWLSSLIIITLIQFICLILVFLMIKKNQKGLFPITKHFFNKNH